MNSVERGRQFLQGLRELSQRTVWQWRRCPRCGQMETWRHGTYPRRPWTFAGRQTERVQRHWCLQCRRTYAEQPALRVRGSWYAREVHRAPFDRLMVSGVLLPLRVSGVLLPLMVSLSNHAADGRMAAVVAGAAGALAAVAAADGATARRSVLPFERQQRPSLAGPRGASGGDGGGRAPGWGRERGPGGDGRTLGAAAW